MLAVCLFSQRTWLKQHLFLVPPKMSGSDNYNRDTCTQTHGASQVEIGVYKLTPHGRTRGYRVKVKNTTNGTDFLEQAREEVIKLMSAVLKEFGPYTINFKLATHYEYGDYYDFYLEPVSYYDLDEHPFEETTIQLVLDELGTREVYNNAVRELEDQLNRVIYLVVEQLNRVISLDDIIVLEMYVEFEKCDVGFDNVVIKNL